MSKVINHLLHDLTSENQENIGVIWQFLVQMYEKMQYYKIAR